MSTLDLQSSDRSALDEAGSSQASSSGGSTPAINVGSEERKVSIAAGSILALLGVSRRSIPGLIIAGVGASLIHRGVTGHCSAYSKLGVNTDDPSASSDDSDASIAQTGIHVETAFLINKPASVLYDYWRDFTNLPSIMTHLESVQLLDEKKSHWVVKVPRLVGGTVEWDAEVTADEPNQRIGWRSIAGGSVDTEGEVRFSQAMGDRGTEVHVDLYYRPPAGVLGKWIITLLGENPKRAIREDLRNFKRKMELGEVLTTEGQPRGSCATGQGIEQHESDWKPLYT